MIYIPLVYFSILSLFLYRRHKHFDIAVIISLMFALSGLFSVFMDNLGYRSYESSNYHISFLSSFVYCFLLTLCILPIHSCDIFKKVNVKPLRNVKLIKFISVASIIWFILIVLLGRNTLTYVLNSDLADVRADLYAGESVGDGWMSKMPTPLRFIFSFFNLAFGCPWILIFLGFYSMIGGRVSLKYSYFFLIASLSSPIYGIMGADRSATAYWIISVVVLFVLFHRQLPHKAKKQLCLLGLIVFIGLFAYLFAMTMSRFGERDSSGGALGSLISYFGQSYINFCFFFDEYNLPYHHFGIVFPFTSQYLFGIPSGGVPIQQEMSRLSLMETGVFYTFIGHMIIGIGQAWAVFFTILYTILSSIQLGKIKRKPIISIDSLFLYFALASVPLLGLFGHYYASPATTFSLLFMYFIIKKLM